MFGIPLGCYALMRLFLYFYHYFLSVFLCSLLFLRFFHSLVLKPKALLREPFIRGRRVLGI